jgi:cytochrome b
MSSREHTFKEELIDQRVNSLLEAILKGITLNRVLGYLLILLVAVLTVGILHAEHQRFHRFHRFCSLVLKWIAKPRASNNDIGSSAFTILISGSFIPIV